MGGGLLNLIAEGAGNNFLTGNPTKTFFKSVFVQHTNFGLQKFRIDYEGQRNLRLTEQSKFTFKISRHADLLLDSYIVINLPDIFSPIHQPCAETDYYWAPYEFKWIKNLGTSIVQNIEITAGNSLLASYSGDYLNCVNCRDLSTSKKEAFDKMSGHVPEINDPANSGNRQDTYPSAYYTGENTLGQEPSIRGRKLYIPISAWFSLNSKSALPLVALQYCEVSISVTLRPIQQLFQVRDVFDPANNFPYVAPDFTRQEFQMYRFLQSPPNERINPQFYNNTINDWNADVHLVCTYAFLSTDETRAMVNEQQSYLVRDVMQYSFQNITGSKRVELKSLGMVSSWMFFLRRNDINLRNEWSNFSNWPYNFLPQDLQLPPETSDTIFSTVLTDENGLFLSTGPRSHPGGLNTNIYVTGFSQESNRKEILMSLGILLDGTYRENTLSESIVNYVEKFSHCDGNLPDGVYTYNFGLNPSVYNMQPSGAINMSSFKSIELEVATFLPTIDRNASNFQFICAEGGNVIGVRKENWRLFEYSYDLVVLEERFNVLMIKNGDCKMMIAR